MPQDNSVPIVIVQHMPNEFINGLARWLASVTSLNVQVATDNMSIERGMIILAPGDANLSIVRRNGRLHTQLIREPAQSRYMPSVDVLFESIAMTIGNRAVGIILTGMGDDGARGLLSMRRAGAYTLVQDETSSTVFGMPRAAIELGAAHKILSLADLPSKIMKML
jgi:two-component system chemotaxis response regulator CheB